MSSFSSPIFSITEIFRLLNSSGFSIKQEDLTAPSSDVICALYVDILDRLDPLGSDVDGQLPFAALDILENPDSHVVGVGKVQLFYKMNAFLDSIQGGGIAMRDLTRPDSRHTTEILSSFINYMLYMEEKTKLLGPIVDQSPSIEERRVEIKERIAEINRNILDHEAACELEQPIVEGLDAEVKNLKQTIHNFNKEQMSIKARALELKDRMDAVNDKISQANYELVKSSQENSKLSSMVVQSPYKLQRALEEKKATQTEVMSAERSAMVSVKERVSKLDVYSKGCEKLSRHYKKMEALQEQVNSTKAIDKDVKSLKAKLSNDGLLNKSLEAQVIEAKGKAKQALELVNTAKTERDTKIAEHTKMFEEVKIEMDGKLHALEQRESIAEAIVAKGEKLNREIDLVREAGKAQMSRLTAKGAEIYNEYHKYVDNTTVIMDRVIGECMCRLPSGISTQVCQ